MNWTAIGEAGPVPCWRADPATLPAPAVIVLPEIFGLNAYIRGVVDQLAATGFVAVAPELFHRNAPGFLAGYDADGMAAGRAQVAALDYAAFHADIDGILVALAGDVAATRRAGVLGFCFGGLLAWECNGLHPFGAAVSFYGRAHSPASGGRPPLSRTSTMRGPLLAHFASDDPSIPPEAVGACAAALVGAPVRGTIEVWPGTHHGFHCWDRGAYEPASAKAAWDQTVRFLRANLA
jgi:carboxymethylenebutenolidase